MLRWLLLPVTARACVRVCVCVFVCVCWGGGGGEAGGGDELFTRANFTNIRLFVFAYYKYVCGLEYFFVSVLLALPLYFA